MPSIFRALDFFATVLSIVMSAKSVLTGDVINFTAECNVKNVTYKDGDSFYIPQNPINYNDIDCKVCSCDRGATTCPNKAKCDVFHKVPCEKLIPAPQGKCCPTCGKLIWCLERRRGAMAKWFSTTIDLSLNCQIRSLEKFLRFALLQRLANKTFFFYAAFLVSKSVSGQKNPLKP